MVSRSRWMNRTSALTEKAGLLMSTQDTGMVTVIRGRGTPEEMAGLAVSGGGRPIASDVASAHVTRYMGGEAAEPVARGLVAARLSGLADLRTFVRHLDDWVVRLR